MWALCLCVCVCVLGCLCTCTCFAVGLLNIRFVSDLILYWASQIYCGVWVGDNWTFCPSSSFAVMLLLPVSCCFEPSQPLGIISGLKETFIKRHIVEWTTKAEIGLEEQCEKTESCRENLWNEIQPKGPQRQKQTREQNKKKSIAVKMCHGNCIT